MAARQIRSQARQCQSWGYLTWSDAARETVVPVIQLVAVITRLVPCVRREVDEGQTASNTHRDLACGIPQEVFVVKHQSGPQALHWEIENNIVP